MLAELVQRFWPDEMRAVKVTGYHPRDPVLAEWLAAGQNTVSGVKVTPTNSMNFSVVLRCIALISGQEARLPLNVCQRISDTKSEIIEGHPVHQLLNARSNPFRRAKKTREAWLAHAVSWGNGYLEVERDGAGRPLALHMMRPDRTRPKMRDDGSVIYEWNPDRGETKNLRQDQVLHLSGLGYDDLEGYSVLSLAREAIGMGLSAEQFGAAFYGNNAQPGGFLKHPGKLSAEAQKKLREQFGNVHGGPRKAFKLAVLEEGMDYANASLIPPRDAQFLESRTFQLLELCRFFGVPPHLVFEMDRATYANSEQHWLEFVGFGLRYWLDEIEDCCEQSLLTPEELEDGIYIEHDVTSIVMPDMKTQFEAVASAVEKGIFTPNMAMRVLGKNDIGPQGDLIRWPINMIPADRAEDWADAQVQVSQSKAQGVQDSNGPEGDAPGGGGPEPKTSKNAPATAPTQGPSPIPYMTDERALDAAIQGMLRHQLQKISRLEVERVRKAATKCDGFLDRVENFFSDQHREHLRKELQPVFGLLEARGAPKIDLESRISEHISARKTAILEASGRAVPASLEQEIDAETASWESKIPHFVDILAENAA